jgi:hypothetical protein
MYLFNEYKFLYIIFILLFIICGLILVKYIFEFYINKELNNKKYATRSFETIHKPVSLFSKKLVLTGVFPVLLLSAVLMYPGVQNDNNFDLELSTLESIDDLNEYYISFQNSIDGFESSIRNSDVDDFLAAPTYEGGFDDIQDEYLNGSDYVDMIQVDNYLTIVKDDTISLYTLNNEQEFGFIDFKNEIVDFNHISNVHAYNNEIVVVSKDIENENLISYVNINDIDDIINIGTVSGDFIDSTLVNDKLLIVTKTLIPYGNETDIYQSIPQYNTDTVVRTNFSEMSFVEGTNPSSFISLYVIDMKTYQVNMETIIGDDSSNIALTSKQLFVSSDFYQASSNGEFVQKTILYRMNVFSGEIITILVEQSNAFDLFCNDSFCILESTEKQSLYSISDEIVEVDRTTEMLTLTSKDSVVTYTFNEDELVINWQSITDVSELNVDYSVVINGVNEYDYSIVGLNEYSNFYINGSNESAYKIMFISYDMDSLFQITNHFYVSHETSEDNLFVLETINLEDTLYILTFNGLYAMKLNDISTFVELSLD